MIEKWLQGKKTYIIAAAGFLAAVAAWANGEMGGDVAFTTGLLAALAATLRAGVNKNGNGGAK